MYFLRCASAAGAYTYSVRESVPCGVPGPFSRSCLISGSISYTVIAAPSNTGLPQIAGSAQQGQTLTATVGTWSDPQASISYQWEDCDTSGNSCVSIDGATSSTYTLAAADVGHTVVVVVTQPFTGFDPLDQA